MLNLRRRAARNDRKRYQEDGVVLPKGKPGRKKAVKGVIIPAIPDGETEETIETQRKELVEMHKNGTRDLLRIRMLMDNTFAKRRRDVLINSTRVWQLLQQYPCLKNGTGTQIKGELDRVLEKENIAKDMRTIWETKKLATLKTLKKSKSSEVQRILALLDNCEAGQEKGKSISVSRKRTSH